jgi:hypothetical protein
VLFESSAIIYESDGWKKKIFGAPYSAYSAMAKKLMGARKKYQYITWNKWYHQ